MQSVNMAKKASPVKNLDKMKPDFSKIKNYLPNIKRLFAFNYVSSFLSIIFYVIWILIGLFVLWFIYANFRLGAFDQLIGKQRQVSAQSAADPQSQQPTETTVPGIGKVNIACVQTSLSEESILKMVKDKSSASLTSDEKAKLEKCIIEKDQAAPSPAK